MDIDARRRKAATFAPTLPWVGCGSALIIEYVSTTTATSTAPPFKYFAENSDEVMAPAAADALRLRNPRVAPRESKFIVIFPWGIQSEKTLAGTAGVFPLCLEAGLTGAAVSALAPYSPEVHPSTCFEDIQEALGGGGTATLAELLFPDSVDLGR